MAFHGLLGCSYDGKRGMALAAILGVIAGVLGFAPLILGQVITRKTQPQKGFSRAGALLVGVIASIVVLAVCVVACIVFAREYALPFSLGEVGGLIAAAIVYGLTVFARRK